MSKLHAVTFTENLVIVEDDYDTMIYCRDSGALKIEGWRFKINEWRREIANVARFCNWSKSKKAYYKNYVKYFSSISSQFDQHAISLLDSPIKSLVPYWANWLVQDSFGRWWYAEKEPQIDEKQNDWFYENKTSVQRALHNKQNTGNTNDFWQNMLYRVR